MAPAARMCASAIASRWAVETPALISASMRSRTSATSRPARRMRSISARDLRVTISGGPDRVVSDGGQEVVGDLVDGASAVHGPKDARPAVMLDDLGEGRELHGQPSPDRIDLVVRALDQRGTVDVAPAGDERRVRVLVVDVPGLGADP